MTESREIISSKNHLGLVYQLSKRSTLAETLLREILVETRIKYGPMDLLAATCLNNLGFVLKSQAKNDQSKLMYEEALDIRTAILGMKHPETIVSMHNLAELLIACGENDRASKLQHKILEIIDKSDDKTKTIDNSGMSSNTKDQSTNKIISTDASVTRTEKSNTSGNPATNSLNNGSVKPSTRLKRK